MPFRIKLKSTLPDIFFGILDNGLLAVFAIFGAHFAGVTGAIIGGVVGNAITDGIAGFFEGYSAEKLRLQNVSEKRTMLKSAVGKMAGCLLGAGIVLTIASFIKF
jgi:outer membrane lipoprotein SlyB